MTSDALVSLKDWQPFKIDALGLVTLLGADDLNRALGRLSQSRVCEFLPLLAPFIIAGNIITKEVPGATLYNVTDGIVAVDVSGWFVRWLMTQKLGWNSSTLVISYNARKCMRSLALISSLMIGVATMGPMIAVSAAQLDWFGLANSVALLCSVIVRYVILSQNRKAIDISAELGLDPVASFGKGRDMVKAFCTLPGGRFVTVYCPRGIMIQCLLTSPRPPSRRLYSTALAICWVATAVHIITIGMVALADQIICVAILIASTLMVAYGVGYDEGNIGTKLGFYLSDAEDDGRRAAYARLRLSPTEEDTLYKWRLFPQRSNTEWWERYRNMDEHAWSRGTQQTASGETLTDVGASMATLPTPSSDFFRRSV